LHLPIIRCRRFDKKRAPHVLTLRWKKERGDFWPGREGVTSVDPPELHLIDGGVTLTAVPRAPGAATWKLQASEVEKEEPAQTQRSHRGPRGPRNTGGSSLFAASEGSGARGASSRYSQHTAGMGGAPGF